MALITALMQAVMAAASQSARASPPFAVEGNSGCFDFPAVRAMPAALFQIQDVSPGAQLIIAAPGHAVPPLSALHPPKNCTGADGCRCTAFASGVSVDCPAFMYAGSCYCLGNTNFSRAEVTLLDPVNATAGVYLYYGGGVGGAGCAARGTRYKMVCDPAAPAGAGPASVVEHTPAACDVTVTWPTPAACVAVPSTGCVKPPLPTPDQLMYHQMEVGALISFNMATAAESQGCGPGAYPPASTFNDHVPTVGQTDQWCQAIVSFGGKWATLVAKHECGFALWPTKASSAGFVYNYSVPEGVDYVRQVAESCAAVGVRLGVYYSVNANSYLDVWNNVAGGAKVTQEQYEDIVLQQLAELWGNYGPIVEIWFDGGPNLKGDGVAKMVALKEKLQPQAVTFGGCAAFGTNSVAWVGTESGHAPYPLWYDQDVCGTAAAGNAMADKIYEPYEVDCTIQQADGWFYNEHIGYKSIVELAGQYHDSVGHGGNLLLNLAPPINTSIPAAAMRLYAELGNWTRRCYGEGGMAAVGALASTASTVHNCSNVRLGLKTPAVIDRLLIKEELAGGQRIMAFRLLVDGVQVYNGTAIGSAHIALLGRNVTGTVVELEITATRGGMASVRLFAVPDPMACWLPAASGGCSLVPDTLYSGVALHTLSVGDVQACCHACRNSTECAVFTAVTGTVWPYPVACKLMGAMTGEQPQAGTVSGSPVWN